MPHAQKGRSTGSRSITASIAEELIKVEKIEPVTEDVRLAGKIPKNIVPLEIVMHFDVDQDYLWEEQFLNFAVESGVHIEQDLQYQTRGLWFLAAQGNEIAARKLAQFSFVRTVRPMPVMRAIEVPKTLRSTRGNISFILPSEAALDIESKVAIFDAGLPSDHPFKPWVKAIEPAPSDGIGAPISDLLFHGSAVTSALLFGHVGSRVVRRPFCNIDHYRVLGDMTNDRKLYSAMLYVDKILSTSNYEFASFSVGPEEIVGDDKVTAWTAMLDDHFQQGSLLAGIAVGNDGSEDPPFNRVQVPSDCVNALSVGSADGRTADWVRAPYSSVGPGRAPGSVKPDLVMPGGSDGNEFRFIMSGPSLGAGCGTSYSTPALMRVAAGLRAHFGREISILGIRALLVHSADANQLPRSEVGWGMPPDDLSEITVCPDGSIRVLYQGMIEPSKVIRAEVPMPTKTLVGRVSIRATFCYVCQTDPHTPGDYTRAGLDIQFRPNKLKLPKPINGKPPNKEFPSTKSFFEGVGRQTEQTLRTDGFKWDTMRHAERRFNASSLNEPVFDIHYVARQPGSKNSPSAARKLPYALVITVTAEKYAALYEDIVAKYGRVLEVIRPRVQLPLRT